MLTSSSLMGGSVDLEDVRQVAIAFLQDIIDRSVGQSSQDIAQSIINLAFQDGNPVRDLFTTAVPTVRTIPPSPTRSALSRSSSKFIDKVTRRESKSISSDDKSSTLSKETTFDKTANTGKVRRSKNPTPTSSRIIHAENADSNSIEYNCILCEEDMSSKGVCKRHLNEQHLSKNMYKCDKCGCCFNLKSEAKKHSASCGQNVWSYHEIKPEAKKIYSSELTGECFTSKSKYLEHLLDFSKKTDRRPQPSQQRKLRGLLSQPSILPRVEEISDSIHGSREAWRSLSWEDAQLCKAVKHLEDAAIVIDDGTIAFSAHLMGAKSLNQFIRTLLIGVTACEKLNEDVLRDTYASIGAHRQKHRSSIATTAKRHSTVTVEDSSLDLQLGANKVELPESDKISLETLRVPSTSTRISHELKGKRHLSDQSRLNDPPRQPPEPPRTPVALRNSIDTELSEMQNSQPAHVPLSTLRYRSQDGNMMSNQYTGCEGTLEQSCDLNTTDRCPTSDVVDGSTLLSHFDPNVWSNVQVMRLDFDDSGNHDMLDAGYYPQSNTSIRTPSIATDRTYANSIDADDSNMSYIPFPGFSSHRLGTFLFDEDDFHDFHGHNQTYTEP